MAQACRITRERTARGKKTVGTARAITTALTLLRRMGRKIVEGFEHFAEYRGKAIAAVMRRRTE